MSIAIVKYNAGNIFSVDAALKRLNVEATITDDHDFIRRADKVIFPGVGEAGSAMKYLKEQGLDRVIKNLTQPVLGICIGMQLLCQYSEESDTDCLGIFDTDVKLFVPTTNADKIPHMGWNTITNVKNPLFTSDIENEYVYYVHSYYVPVNSHTIAQTDYIQPFSAALQKDNFFATQFHTEKSGKIGETILKNFLDL